MANWIKKSSGYFELDGDPNIIVHDNGICPWPNTPVRWWYNINGYIGHVETEAAAKAVVERIWRPQTAALSHQDREPAHH